MNTQDMDRLVSEFHAHIQNAERCGADQAFKEAALNYQRAAEICSRLVERTTGAEAQEWLKKQAACEKKTRKLLTELYTGVRKSEPETGSADDTRDAQAEETDEPAAADLNDKDACCRLGLPYYDGHGVEQDYAQAVEWFRKAAERDHEKAQLALADCYEQGLVVPKDQALAAHWRAKSKDKNT